MPKQDNAEPDIEKASWAMCALMEVTTRRDTATGWTDWCIRNRYDPDWNWFFKHGAFVHVHPAASQLHWAQEACFSLQRAGALHAVLTRMLELALPVIEREKRVLNEAIGFIEAEAQKLADLEDALGAEGD